MNYWASCAGRGLKKKVLHVTRVLFPCTRMTAGEKFRIRSNACPVIQAVRLSAVTTGALELPASGRMTECQNTAF